VISCLLTYSRCSLTGLLASILPSPSLPATSACSMFPSSQKNCSIVEPIFQLLGRALLSSFSLSFAVNSLMPLLLKPLPFFFPRSPAPIGHGHHPSRYAPAKRSYPWLLKPLLSLAQIFFSFQGAPVPHPSLREPPPLCAFLSSRSVIPPIFLIILSVPYCLLFPYQAFRLLSLFFSLVFLVPLGPSISLILVLFVLPSCGFSS